MKRLKRLEKVGLLAAGLWIAGTLWCAPLALASGVYLDSPSNGATVSGTVAIVTSIDANVIWIDLDIDSHFFAASPPFNFSWDTTKVGNGTHSITAYAFNNSGRLGTASISVTVNNTGSGGTTYYVAPTGSDSNSGTSVSAAWQTLKRVNSANLMPGDTVSFQSG